MEYSRHAWRSSFRCTPLVEVPMRLASFFPQTCCPLVCFSLPTSTSIPFNEILSEIDDEIFEEA
jgi:hypothetical protein